MNLEVELLYQDSKTPTKANKNDAGYDLYSIKDGTVLPNSISLIPIGIKIAIPVGYYGRIAPRSSLAIKNGVDVLGGVVDSCYKGEVCIILINHSANVYEYKKGDRLAQIIITPCKSLEVIIVDKLSSLNRGGGFGSTGV